MKKPIARCVATPDKPLTQFTKTDLAALRAPTVEEHLWNIRHALALIAATANGLDTGIVARLADETHEDALDGMIESCEDALALVRQLIDGLPAEVHNLAVVVPSRGAENEA